MRRGTVEHGRHTAPDAPAPAAPPPAGYPSAADLWALRWPAPRPPDLHRQPTTRARRRRILLGVATFATVAALGTAGLLWPAPHSPAARAPAPAAAPAAAPPSSAFVDITTRSSDRRPLTARELFPTSRITVDRRTYTVIASLTGCTGLFAVAGCAEVVTATLRDPASRRTVNLHVANLATDADAQAVAAQLAGPTASASNRGHFLIYVTGRRTDARTARALLDLRLYTNDVLTRRAIAVRPAGDGSPTPVPPARTPAGSPPARA